ncbi:hypothetical protein ACJJTC_013307 [Scirpophaga incertulas]
MFSQPRPAIAANSSAHLACGRPLALVSNGPDRQRYIPIPHIGRSLGTPRRTHTFVLVLQTQLQELPVYASHLHGHGPPLMVEQGGSSPSPPIPKRHKAEEGIN